MAEGKKLIGVIIIGVLVILIGLLVMYMTWGIVSSIESGWDTISISIFSMAFCVIICAVFLMKRKNWARLFFIFAMWAWFGFGVMCVVNNFLFGLIVYSMEFKGYAYLWIFGFIIPSLAVIIYLTRKKVKMGFHQSKEQNT